MLKDETPPCSKCGGIGKIPIDDMHSQLCSCSWLRMMKAHLGPEVMGVPTPKGSLLYVLSDQRGKPAKDLTRSNLFIKSTWRSLLPHLKWTLFYKGLHFRFKTVTDELILDVRLGRHSAALKTKKERDEVASMNSLHDLVEDADLVIVRLGRLGHKNIAAAGYLKEALMIRETAYKPTWILEEPGSPFVGGTQDDGRPLHFTYSEELAEYIWDHYEVVDLIGDAAPAREEPAEPEEIPGMSTHDVDEDTNPTEESPDLDMSAYETKREKKPKYRGRR